MVAKDFCFYFSGLETQPEVTDKFLTAGKLKLKGAMMSYLTFRGGQRHTDWLVKWKKDFGVKVMVDSGAHAFVYAENVEAKAMSSVVAGWHPVNSEVEVLLKDPDKYIHEYMDWLEAHRDAYDYAVELDIQKIVGQEKVDVWREEFIARKIPLVIVLHVRAGDNIETVRKWKGKGVDYFGYGEFSGENVQDMRLLREISAEGVKVHVFAFSPHDLGKYLEWMDSTDSSSWLSAGKLGQLVVAKGRSYETPGVKDSPILVMKAVSVLSEVLDKAEVEASIKAKKYAPLNFFNMMEMQKWIDTIAHKPAYARQLATAAKGETVLPDWVNEKDKMGRPKSIYLQSRFNNYRCYSDDTEILTEEGWKLIKGLQRGLKVAALEDGELRFREPLNYFEYDYNDELWRLSSKQFDLLVTSNHRMYVRKRGGEFELRQFNELSVGGRVPKSYELKKDARWEGVRKEQFVLPEVRSEWDIPYMERFLKFILSMFPMGTRLKWTIGLNFLDTF